MGNSKFSFLEEYHAHSVLLILLEKPGILRSTLYDLTKASRPTAQKRVDELITEGLIRIEPSKTHIAGQHLFLTDKGKQIAELTAKIKAVLDGEDVHETNYGTPPREWA